MSATWASRLRIDRLLDEALRAGRGDKAALVQHGVVLGYAALEQRVDIAAASLRAAGVSPGERVLLVGENSVDIVVLLFAVLRLRAWAVPLNARLSAAEVDAIRAHCEPRLAYFATRTSPDAALHAERCGAVVQPLDGLHEGQVALCTSAGAAADGSDDGSADDVAVMIYTSGSTGTPKGVMLTHANLDFVTHAALQQGMVLGDDIVFHALPLSHAYGLVLGLLVGLRAGATLHLGLRFSADALAEAIIDQGITVFQGVPAMYARLHEWALASGRALRPNRLRFAYIGGSLVDGARKAQAEALLGLRLHHGYGLTESAPSATRTLGHDAPQDLTAGWPVPGVEVVLRDDAGHPVPPGGRGEVWIRGPNVMRGYFRDPVQTRAAVDADGWLHSGDIGEFGPAGDLAIVGRLKELIIRGGFNVYPAEVERAIAAFDGVAQCAVVGRCVGGDEEIVAFVEPLAGQAVDADALRRFLRGKLAPYKQPAEIVCLPRLPASGTGKLLKAQLKAMAQATAAA